MKLVKGYRKKIYMLIKEKKLHQEDIAIFDTDAPTKCTLSLKKKKPLLQLKSYADPHTMLVEDFTDRLLLIDGTFR